MKNATQDHNRSDSLCNQCDRCDTLKHIVDKLSHNEDYVKEVREDRFGDNLIELNYKETHKWNH